jgi:hypothetical protein
MKYAIKILLFIFLLPGLWTSTTLANARLQPLSFPLEQL